MYWVFHHFTQWSTSSLSAVSLVAPGFLEEVDWRHGSPRGISPARLQLHPRLIHTLDLHTTFLYTQQITSYKYDKTIWTRFQMQTENWNRKTTIYSYFYEKIILTWNTAECFIWKLKLVLKINSTDIWILKEWLLEEAHFALCWLDSTLVKIKKFNFNIDRT